MGQLTTLPANVAKCHGKREGEPPGTPMAPCDTCARYLLPPTGGPDQRYFTTYQRAENGTCWAHMSTQTPHGEFWK